MYKKGLALNNLQWLIWHKIKANQVTKKPCVIVDVYNLAKSIWSSALCLTYAKIIIFFTHLCIYIYIYIYIYEDN